MDINELLEREQVSLLNAGSAACVASRTAHEELARRYGVRLRCAGFPHRPYTADGAGFAGHPGASSLA